ncbi:MAG TPA: hypothetical protein VLA77_01195 [Candidatus Saccharimonadales bacterium]|nr:hypothetical protein [Candidatus Saccharimonadales bacterium]
MKRIFLIVSLCALVLVPSAQVRAQTELQEGLIIERCDIIKQSLDKQRRRDLVSRINRGRDYQNLIDQQQALTDRVRNNGLDYVKFEQRLSELKVAFDNFRKSYTAYDDGLSTLTAIDCKKEPANFFGQLLAVRALRSDVGQKSLLIKDILSLQRDLIVNLRLELQQVEESIVGSRDGN